MVRAGRGARPPQESGPALPAERRDAEPRRHSCGSAGNAIATIYPIWEKACRYMTGHSQPMDTLGIRATVTELKQDWADLQQALLDYEGS